MLPGNIHLTPQRITKGGIKPQGDLGPGLPGAQGIKKPRTRINMGAG